MSLKLLTDVLNFWQVIFERRHAIYELAKRDFQAQNKNTYLGPVWGFIQPLSYIFILNLVFTIGLRSNPAGAIPFVVFLISGMVPFQYFSNALQSLTDVIKSHSFLVRKGDFSLGILHVAKLLGSLVPHVVLLIFAMLTCWFHGVFSGIYVFQLIYYLFALFLLLLGLGWITSSTSLFIQDVANIVVIIVQFGFWLTPIVWNIERVPQRFHWLIKINPIVYIVNGYRDSLVFKIAFWEKPIDTIYFWCFTGCILLFGVIIFRRLKPHFGEVI